MVQSKGKSWILDSALFTGPVSLCCQPSWLMVWLQRSGLRLNKGARQVAGAWHQHTLALLEKCRGKYVAISCSCQGPAEKPYFNAVFLHQHILGVPKGWLIWGWCLSGYGMLCVLLIFNVISPSTPFLFINSTLICSTLLYLCSIHMCSILPGLNMSYKLTTSLFILNTAWVSSITLVFLVFNTTELNILKYYLQLFFHIH